MAPRTISWLIAYLVLIFALLAILSIGIFIVPVAVFLLLANAVADRMQRGGVAARQLIAIGICSLLALNSALVLISRSGSDDEVLLLPGICIAIIFVTLAGIGIYAYVTQAPSDT